MLGVFELHSTMSHQFTYYEYNKMAKKECKIYTHEYTYEY